MEEDLLTIRQAARELGIHRQTVYQAIRRGNLPAVEVLDRVAVRRADIEAYKQRQARVGPQGGRPRTRPEESGPKRTIGRPRKQKEQSA